MKMNDPDGVQVDGQVLQLIIVLVIILKLYFCDFEKCFSTMCNCVKVLNACQTW